MTCQPCTDAEREPQRVGGVSFASCDGCKARRIAKSPQAFDATRGKASDLVALIEAAFPKDYKAGRAEVWRWMQVFTAAREKNK